MNREALRPSFRPLTRCGASGRKQGRLRHNNNTNNNNKYGVYSGAPHLCRIVDACCHLFPFWSSVCYSGSVQVIKGNAYRETSRASFLFATIVKVVPPPPLFRDIRSPSTCSTRRLPCIILPHNISPSSTHLCIPKSVPTRTKPQSAAPPTPKKKKQPATHTSSCSTFS